ncbi:hypothetical protein MNBD_ALPHA12-2111 [hydrothermal vent metagenome]|uniref:Uncharacterized protein n=1 Tax=hydrothermal vent metagenome TaxID=652676 RepID=A0A3B0UI11_9ZZZZ
MKRIIISIALFFMFLVPNAFAAQKQVSLEVGGLTCPSCFYIAGKAMLSVTSVQILKFIEGKNQTAVYVVSYDDEAAEPELIVKAVIGYGYPAKIVATPAS